jgi:hypothetical protein
LYCLGHSIFRITASQNHVGAQSSGERFAYACGIRLNLLECIGVKQVGGYRIVENFWFAVQ